MASNLGWTAIEAEFNHVTTSDQSETPGIRQVFYARYIGWFLSWPGVLYALELVAHQGNLEYNLKTLSSLALEIGSTEIYVLGLLIGILIKSTYKWGYFTFAVAAQLFAIGIIFNRFLVELKTPIKYVLVFSFITLLWILYPICWGLSEGGNVIQVDSEAAFYGVLDVLLFGFVPLALSFLNEKTDDQLTYPEAASEAPEGKKEEAPAARQSGETAVQAETQDGNEVAEQV
ncbi:hypothetical protein PACTADRAFT_48444 [Pachysolen tannophilus NRRL Y-2460]|uniref:Uncharacterized protein n=1 Tax=Pachysolen tannophilus NRRL Y-2460 TaxID=669874 RepID=A0A1E4TXV2_PACTA|nr:hypothetical protein PACTADRAFT_48444 [Pachysolen tannophilus NRRL Y-2460]